MQSAACWGLGETGFAFFRCEKAIEAVERARRLRPFDPYTFLYVYIIAFAHLAARRFEQAIEWADRALHNQPRMVAAMRVKIAANALLGRLDEARAELGRARAIDPGLTIARLRAYAHFAAPELNSMWPACAWLACRRGESPYSREPEAFQL